MKRIHTIPNFVSESGDKFFIEPQYYDNEVKSYREAVKRGDEHVMMFQEEGNTGWILVD